MRPASPLPFDTAAWDRLTRPVWLFDPLACRGVWANRAALVLWDADSLDELLSRDFSALSPAVRTRTQALARATLDGQTVTERWTFYPRGRPETVQASISGLDLTDGRRVLMFEAAPVDVEEGERRAVEALRHTTVQITLFDAAGQVLFANPAAMAAYGEAPITFAGRFVDEAAGTQALASVLAGERLSELHAVTTAQGRRWRQLDALSTLDPVTGAPVVLLNERDVTAQVEAEQAMLAAREDAEAARTKERHLSEMSHALRTPLNAVMGFSGLMRQGPLDPVQSRHLDRIEEAGAELVRIVEAVLEQAEPATAPIQASASAEPSTEPEAGSDTLTILIVDDNAANRALLQALMGAMGHKTDMACDGAEAVAAVKARAYDLVLMDVQMPVMDGLTATCEIRALPSPTGRVPIIGVTANTLPQQLDRYAEGGMNAVCAKPVKPELLFGLIARVLSSRRLAA